MRKQQESKLLLVIFVVLIATVLFLPGLIGAGDMEPSDVPGPTMKTLDQIPPTWSQILPASERFELVMGGDAVLDKETGLVWAKNANISGGGNDWVMAMYYCLNHIIADRRGWRLPTIEELSSLVDLSLSGYPKLPPGVFDNVQTSQYWSSTISEYPDGTTCAWQVYMGDGSVSCDPRTYYDRYVWPVRGGQ